MGEWRTVAIRTSVMEKIASAINDSAGRAGSTVTNPTQFVDLAIREKLERLGVAC